MSEYFVYAAVDDDHQVIYVGYSHQPDLRFASHRNNQPWSREIAGFSFLHGPVSRDEAIRLERSEIEQRCPKHNSQFNPAAVKPDMQLNRDALRVIRERTGHTKGTLAEKAGVDRSLIQRLESGERNASPPVIRRLADALDVPLHALIGPDDEAVA